MMIRTAEQWATEAVTKYGTEATNWLRRWKANCSNYPEDLAELDRAIEIVDKGAR